MSKSDTPKKDIRVKLSKFDYDTPVEEWDEDERQELLDLVAQLDCRMGEALRKVRDVPGGQS